MSSSSGSGSAGVEFEVDVFGLDGDDKMEVSVGRCCKDGQGIDGE